jgi:hypothetical protein
MWVGNFKQNGEKFSMEMNLMIQGG